MPTSEPDPAIDGVYPECDVTRRFVRVLKRRSNGFVEFEFSIGWPELSVELMLPEADFEEFCAVQKARLIEN